MARHLHYTGMVHPAITPLRAPATGAVHRLRRLARALPALAFLVALGACGGGGGGGSAPPPPPPPLAEPVLAPAWTTFTATQAVVISHPASAAVIRYTTDGSRPSATRGQIYAGPVVLAGTTTLRALAVRDGHPDSSVVEGTYTRLPAVVADRPASRAEAARFLNQATFGARPQDVDRLLAIGYEAWFAEQFSLPFETVEDWLANDPTTPAFRDSTQGNPNNSAFYSIAAQSPAQLRARMWWALSQIFVVTTIQSPADQIKYYMTMLQRNAFAEYRTLLGAVAHHGSMGDMLSYIGSRDLPAQNVFPDQNFAREVLQLFSIGLYRLNPDGTPVFDGAGQPIPAYTQDDIIGLAKVWTGLYPDYDDTPEKPYWTRHRLPMVFKNNHHSYAEKRFLGTVLPAYNGGIDNGRFPPELKVQEMETALDTIAAHPNVGPFIGHKLIQRLVVSNPSPGYVRRVAAVFADNGRGVRGDLAAVVKAILLDPEARDRDFAATAPQRGKLREEMLLAMPLLRLLDARSVRAGGRIHDHNPNKREINGIYGRISQEPFRAPGVFNYYRPGHVPPNSALGEQGWVSPELQTLDSLSLLQWSRYLGQSLDRDGTGTWRGSGDFRGDNAFDYSALAAAAADPERLVATVDDLLCGGMLTAPERARIAAQVAEIRLDRDRVFNGIRSASATRTWQLSYGDQAGMRFQVAVPGRIVAIRYLRPREETGSHVGRVWTGDGVELGQATFTGESASGWQEAPLATPVPVSPGAIYTVGVNINAVSAFTYGGFFRRQHGPGVVRSATDANGVINHGPLGPFPRYGNYEAHDYHRDVVFEPDSAHAAAMARIMGEVRIKRALFLVMTHPRFLVQR